jgi:hypothetical protein
MKLEHWRQTLELKGFRLNKTKTKYMRCGFSTIRNEGVRRLALMGRCAL